MAELIDFRAVKRPRRSSKDAIKKEFVIFFLSDLLLIDRLLACELIRRLESNNISAIKRGLVNQANERASARALESRSLISLIRFANQIDTRMLQYLRIQLGGDDISYELDDNLRRTQSALLLQQQLRLRPPNSNSVEPHLNDDGGIYIFCAAFERPMRVCLPQSSLSLSYSLNPLGLDRPLELSNKCARRQPRRSLTSRS